MNIQIHTRSIPQILRRQEARKRASVQEFAPDFAHGNATLDELYQSWGDWAERVGFVRAEFRADGQLVAASVARFDDWFLRMEHRSGTTQEVAAWLARTLANTEVVVEIALSGSSLSEDEDGWVLIRCDRARLTDLEHEVLQVTRDSAQTDESWKQTAQTDIFSLVCLSARLSRSH